MTDNFIPTPPRFYRLSGKVSPVALAIGFPLCLLIAAILGFLCGFLEFLGHVIASTELMLIAELLVVAIAAVVIATACATLFNRFNSRSKAINHFVVLCSALLFLYFAWAGWILHLTMYAGLKINPLFFLFPRSIAGFIAILYRHGSWTFLHEPLKGPPLALVWIAEAAAVIFASIKLADSHAAQTVFCEHCKRWGTSRSLVQIRDVGIPALKSALLAGNIDALAAASPRDLDEDCWCNLLLEGCPACDNTQTLTFQRILYLRDPKQPKTKVIPLIRRLVLTPEQTAKIAIIAASLTPAEADPA